MRYFGISAIKLNGAGTEVDKVFIHLAVRRRDGPTHGWTKGEAMNYTDVAKLISAGDAVWVLKATAPGEYGHTEKVRVKPGQHERLQSYNEKGEPTRSLLDLPTFE